MPYGADAVQAINIYFGKPNIPLGSRQPFCVCEASYSAAVFAKSLVPVLYLDNVSDRARSEYKLAIRPRKRMLIFILYFLSTKGKVEFICGYPDLY